MAEPSSQQPPRGLRLLATALSGAKPAAMLGYGFASGLPFALLIGTLNAWLGEVGVKLATIGVFSWIGLCYSFAFLWAPVVDRLRLPLLARLGRRKSWIIPCQAVLVAGLVVLAQLDPKAAIGPFAAVAFLCALASATQDTAINAWRIDVADAATSVELLSAIYQFGYRTASIVGGAFALLMAAHMRWPQVFLAMAAMLGAVALACLAAPDTPARTPATDEAGTQQAPRGQALLLALVLASWGWAVASLVGFMAQMLAPARHHHGAPVSVAAFTRGTGPWIVVATVLVPLAVAALAHALRRRGAVRQVRMAGLWGAARHHLYGALVAP
ncbi:MAG TPA: MFS transporter, partial [Novosphingobium sp.]|nr:MFS transporter [Novosphingobium sp.]